MKLFYSLLKWSETPDYKPILASKAKVHLCKALVDIYWTIGFVYYKLWEGSKTITVDL